MKNLSGKCLLALLPALLLFSSCKDDDAAADSGCILLTDINGQPVGTYGNCNDVAEQWKNVMLSAAESSYLDFPDSLQNTNNEPVTIEGIAVYPNPVNESHILGISLLGDSDKTVKLKVAFVSASGTLLTQTTLLTPANGALNFMLEEPHFSGGRYYTLYYKALVGTDDQEILSGYGNILICDVPNITDVKKDCF